MTIRTGQHVFNLEVFQIDQYLLAPTHQIPNSRWPLLHYRNVGSPEALLAKPFFDLVCSNGWDTHWIARYGETQRAHYHSYSHECMIVLCGTATVRFGVADTSEDMHDNTYGEEKEEGGVELEARKGDVFIIPAGVAHKTYNTLPRNTFANLTPGEGHVIPTECREEMDAMEKGIEGFSMMGCYPRGSQWDFACGAEGAMTFATTWTIQRPALDPVLGDDERGILGTWTGGPGPYVEGIKEERLAEKRFYDPGKTRQKLDQFVETKG